jgi:hypothetical protein
MRKIITFIAVIVLGIGFSVWGWGLIADAHLTLSWPKVAGTVIHAKVTSYDSRSDGKTTRMYSADVRYSYTVNGTQYSSGQVSLGDSSTSSSGGMEEIVRRYPLGSQVIVYYDPAKPGNALLEPGAAFITHIPFAFGLLCVFAGLIAIFRKGKS